MLTREGAVALALAIAVFLLATNLMSGLLFALDAVLIALLLVGVFTAYGPVRRIRLSHRVPSQGAEDQAVYVETTLVAAGTARFITVEEGWRGTRGRAVIPHLASAVPVTVRLALRPSRRGHYALAPAEVTSRGPLGLYTARRRVASAERIVIWPKTQPVAPEVLAQLMPATEGARRAEPTRAAGDLYGVRDYRRGDDLSRIHWRSSLRRGTIVVRDYERPRAAALMIVVDLDRHQPAERLDGAVRAAASLLCAALDAGADAVVAGWNGEYTERSELATAMAWLAGLVPSGPPLAEVLPTLPARGERRVIVVASSGRALPPVADPVTVILPAGDPAGPGAFVYSPDGAVQAC